MYANHSFTLNPELQRALEGHLQLPPDPVIRPGNQAAQEYAKRGANGAGEAPKAAQVAAPTGLRAERRYAPQTGVAGFMAALDRCRREVLAEYQDDPDLMGWVEDLFSKVKRALGI